MPRMLWCRVAKQESFSSRQIPHTEVVREVGSFLGTKALLLFKGQEVLELALTVMFQLWIKELVRCIED